ncbi:chemotaxis protein CheB [Pseudopedobacter beijingensis]|uniref:protein-glutamate methylesterase n=1 Tax=Pseudopedobacter beijingensis TaxID=1207056 RepID=A0ABW4IE99_9SPHI
MSKKVELIAIGGSAGSFYVILEILQALPLDFCIPILIVIHRKYTVQHDFDSILSRKTNIPVKEISDKEVIRPGIAYLCPPDYHVLIEKEHIFSLDESEKVCFSRPSIDVVFESAADIYASDLLGILLSGANSDGANGLQAIKKQGGQTIVQDLEEAKFIEMPRAAMNQNAQTKVLKTKEIIKYLLSLDYQNGKN